MKGAKLLVGLLVLGLAFSGISELAFARSTSLTTTLVITVKGEPKASLAENDINKEMLKSLALDQKMKAAYVRDVTPDITFSGEKIYTITDRL